MKLMSHSVQRISLGIVRHKNTVLVIERRNKEPGSNGYVLSWAFPGGKIESGETVLDAAVREVLEETGYRVVANRLIDERPHESFPVDVAYVSCTLSESTGHEQSSDLNVAQVQWVEIDKLNDYFTTPLNTKVWNYLTA